MSKDTKTPDPSIMGMAEMAMGLSKSNMNYTKINKQVEEFEKHLARVTKDPKIIPIAIKWLDEALTKAEERGYRRGMEEEPFVSGDPNYPCYRLTGHDHDAYGYCKVCFNPHPDKKRGAKPNTK